MSADKKPFLTERESEVLTKSWLCMKAMPEVDIEKLARLTGYENPRSVSNVLGAIKKKIQARAVEAGEDAAPLTPKKAKGTAAGTPASRKRKTPANSAGDYGEEVDTPTPTKRGRKKAVKTEPEPLVGSEETKPSVLKKNGAVKEEKERDFQGMDDIMMEGEA